MSIFQGLFKHIDIYNAERSLQISVLETLFVDAEKVFNKKKQFFEYRTIRDSLKKLWIDYGKTTNRYFIYFLCSRKRILLHKIHVKKDKYILNLQLGDTQKNISFDRQSFQSKFSKEVLDIAIVENNIFIYFENITVKYDAHNFLRTFSINLDELTNIHYIGCTKNPLKRPLNGEHRGLSKALFELRNTNCDLFYAYSIFKLNSNNAISDSMFITATNTYTQEIDLPFEGLIIEKILIKYFLDENLLDNYKNEIKKLEAYKRKLSKLNYRNISLVFGYTESSEYYSFYTAKRSYQLFHQIDEKIRKDRT